MTRIDNSPLINDYLGKAYDSYKSNYMAVAESCCDKILEIEDTNYQAWLLKGKTAGRQSTLDKPRFTEGVDAFIHAVKNVPQDNRKALLAEIKDETLAIAQIFISVNTDEFVKSPSLKCAQQIISDVGVILKGYRKFEAETGEEIKDLLTLEPIGIYLQRASIRTWEDKVIPEYEGKDKHPNKEAWEQFIDRTDGCELLLGQAECIVDDSTRWIEIHCKMIAMQEAIINSCAWEQKFENSSMIWCKSCGLIPDEVSRRQTAIRDYKYDVETAIRVSNNKKSFAGNETHDNEFMGLPKYKNAKHEKIDEQTFTISDENDMDDSVFREYVGLLKQKGFQYFDGGMGMSEKEALKTLHWQGKKGQEVVWVILFCDNIDDLKRSLRVSKSQVNFSQKNGGKISENDSGFCIATSKKSGGCYIATCVYGSYDCPPVWTLRRFRDFILAKTWYGRTFIHMYYAVSPTFVKWFGNTTWFKKIWKVRLDKMVKKLNDAGIEDGQYEDKQF